MYLELAKRTEARLRATQEPADLAAMPLDVFATARQMLEVRVPWCSDSLWFVPAETDAEALAREGICRGQIWTARELHDLLSIPSLTKDTARTVASAKRAMAGDVTAVHPGADRP